MDGSQFDILTRTITASISRRVTLGGLAGGVLAALDLAQDGNGLAKKKGGKKGKKDKKDKKKQKCSAGNPVRCGKKCCRTDQTCRKGKCLHHCEDDEKNFGETGIDCGGSCRDVRKCKLLDRCTDDADCFNNVCVNRPELGGDTCVDCRIDSDCDRLGDPLSLRCFNNKCAECALNADCPRPGQPPEKRFCVEPVAGFCLPGQPCVCGECRTSADCPANKPFCDSAINVCRQCFVDGDCPRPGQPAEQRFCVEPVDGECPPNKSCVCRECRTSDDCPPGRVCDEQNSCFAGTCEAGQDFCQDGRVGCNGNNQCICRQTVANEPFCAQPGSFLSGCTSAAACAAVGPGAQCVRVRGTCGQGGTTCALPCS